MVSDVQTVLVVMCSQFCCADRGTFRVCADRRRVVLPADSKMLEVTLE